MYSEAVFDQAKTLRDNGKQHCVKVIAVTAGKGGVGKSSISVNMAIALARKGNRVMLLDADLGLANIDVLLGLQPTSHLHHVIQGRCTLRDIMIDGPEGIKIIPAASGITSMTTLSSLQHAGIISAFNELSEEVDILIVDTAAGIDSSVTHFTRCADDVIVVVCDEPTSITDAYALIKVMSREHDICRFQVIANMVEDSIQGRALFSKLNRVSEQFLDVSLSYLGCVVFDDYLRKSIRAQRAVVSAYPGCVASNNFRAIAEKIVSMPRLHTHDGRNAFFVEQFMQCI